MKQNEMEKLEHLVRMLRMGATVAAQESEAVPDSDRAAISVSAGRKVYLPRQATWKSYSKSSC